MRRKPFFIFFSRMDELKPEDLFNFLFIHTYYENQEENYNLDLDANCAISIEFYKWSKGQ